MSSVSSEDSEKGDGYHEFEIGKSYMIKPRNLLPVADY